MTPKEKAEELVNKYKPYMYAFIGSDYLVGHESPELRTSQAKQCALIAVDEILEATPHSPSLPLELMPHFSAMKYWQEVKQEIEKL